ncbi:MAG: DUF899 family protein [Acidimicrobiales bacterium]
MHHRPVGSSPSSAATRERRTRVGTREEWLAARLTLLDEEKALNRRRDELAEQGFEQ